MARKAASPWRIYPRGGYAWIDTTIAGRRIRASLGVAYAEPPSREQRRVAQATAEERYRELIAGRVIKAGARVTTVHTFEEAFGSWLDEIETPNNRGSIATRRTYGRNFLAWAESLTDALTPFERIAADWGPRAFMLSRFSRVLRKTVRKELSTLMVFLEWCLGRGFVSAIPPRPALPSAEPGVRAGMQRAKPVAISSVEAARIVASLPEWSVGRKLRGERHAAYRVRAPLEFAWEMAMRPITVARLSVPENWRPGSRELTIRDADDKARFGRVLRLTARAAAILEECAPKRGVIFGEHDYDAFLKSAALKVLPTEKALAFAAYDFRHGRAKALLRAGASLEGVAYILGHKQLTTTNVYLAGDGRESGDEAIALVDGTISSHDADEESDSSVGAGGFEPPTPRPPVEPTSESVEAGAGSVATEDAGSSDEPPSRPRHSAQFRHAEAIVDSARGLVICDAVWAAFDAFSFANDDEEAGT